MKRLTCEMCGSTDLIKQDGVFVCQACGCKYSIEEARKMMVEGTVDVSGSTVKVDNTGLIDSYLQTAENALRAQNNEEAENYANKIIEIDPTAYRAWFIKGKAAGWQTTGRNNRYPESIVNWCNAWKFAPEEMHEALADEIEEEAKSISAAILQMECNSFTNYRSEDNFNDVTNALTMIQNQFSELFLKTKIDCDKEPFKTQLARIVNSGAVNASNEADKDFGPENRNRDKYQWERYTAAQDWCLSLLDKAYSLTEDDDLCFTICKNYIAIAEAVKDSCSYTYENGGYIRDYSFTDSAKKNRAKAIDNWKEKSQKHDPEKRKSELALTQAMISESHSAEEQELARRQYWQEHASEKAALDQEKAALEAQTAELQQTAEQNPDRLEMIRINGTIGELERQLRGLGFFKGKEKRALQEQIDAQTAQRNVHENAWRAASKQNEEAQNKLKQRLTEIEGEFKKNRGSIKKAPTRILQLFENGELVPTGMQLLDYHKAILPEDFRIEKEGEEAIHNRDKMNFDLITSMNELAKTLAKLTGQPATIVPQEKEYKDDPNKEKEYGIYIECMEGTESKGCCNLIFRSKTPHTKIESPYYYQLSGAREARHVSHFVQFLTAALLGICPDLDMDALAELVAKASFGFCKEGSCAANGILVTVTGSTKKMVQVELTAQKESAD